MLHNQILNWYFKYKRELPWRETQDPYLIWISEIMLQQTRVATVIDYFYRFTQQFPTVSDLATAPEQEVLNLWQGLGYYSRARNLHQAAKTIHEKYNGEFPSTYKEILSLKGIGTYTAAAIASFAYNLPHAVLDGNVFRVLSRIYGIDTPIDSTQGKKKFQQLATETMADAEPQNYNQAIIEFGALQCTPKSPNCNECPLQNQCFAFANNLIEQLPIKSKKIKVSNRYFYFLFIHDENDFLISKRTEKDIWLNLYQYPLLEQEKETNIEQLMASNNWKAFFNDQDVIISDISETIVHKLSHQNLHTQFIHIKADLDYISKNKNIIRLKKENWNQYPFPKLIENHIKKW